MPDYRASWYSQLPAFGWFDREDRPGSNALGVPDWQQGIALPSRRTLGQWFNVRAPGGQSYRLQQTDVGPAPWTGRGVDISAAAAHQMGYTPKTFPTDARFTVEAEDGSELPANASLTQGRSMPSLMDMLQQPQSFGDRLGGMSNSLIGLGMGLLQPTNPYRGTNAWTNALEGYQLGSALDQRGAAQRQQLATQAYDRLWREQEAARAQANADRAYGLQLQQFEQAGWQKVKDPETEEEYFYNPKDGRVMRPGGGQPATASAAGGAYTGGAAVPYTGGGPMATGAGGAFPQATTATGQSKDAITMPNGQVVEPPPGLPPSARKEWRKHVLTIQADAAAGKSTEQQSNSALYASNMEIAERALGGGKDAIGTHQGFRATENVPFGLGAYAQSDPYKDYRVARDNFVNSYLRRTSGATIRDDEFLRQERNFFPQPGDTQQQIEQKRLYRQAAIADMKRGAGPGYVSPQQLKEMPDATGSNAPKAPTGPTAPQRPSNIPAGSAYSPSRNQWRSPSGQIFDAEGKPL